MTTPAKPNLRELRALYDFVCAKQWRACKLKDSASRDEMVSKLTEEWLSGPDSSESECFFVIGTEDSGEEVTTAVTGNGPQRRELAMLLAKLHESLPALLRIAEALKLAVQELRCHQEDYHHYNREVFQQFVDALDAVDFGEATT